MSDSPLSPLLILYPLTELPWARQSEAKCRYPVDPGLEQQKSSFRGINVNQMAQQNSYAFMFSSLRDKSKETQGKVPCGGHFRVRQNLPEHTQSWLGSKWLWLTFIVVLYVILKFRDGEKNKVQTPPTLRGCTFRPPGRKNASPNKDYAFSTLTQLEMDLVKFVSQVRNLKVTMATSGHFRLQNLRGADPHHNITIYEIWGEEDYAD